MGVFKIEFFVDDKNLPDVLRELAARKAMNLNVVPVLNAVARPNGKLTQKHKGDELMKLFLDGLKGHEIITPYLARDAAVKAGASKASHSYLLGKATNEGFLKRGKKVKADNGMQIQQYVWAGRKVGE